MEQKKLTLKSWSPNDRPRERLLNEGKKALSDAELLAILLVSGNGKETVVDLSRRILSEAASNQLHKLGKLSVEDLCQFHGIGQAKAISIVAAFELGRRYREAAPESRVKVGSSRDVFDHVRHHLSDLPHEEFHVVHLNRANQILGMQRLSMGGISGTVVDTRLLFKHAINRGASSVIVTHNHPSGNLSPSQEDIRLTERLQEAGKILEIPVLDHLIVAETGYFSFADQGLLKT